MTPRNWLINDLADLESLIERVDELKSTPLNELKSGLDRLESSIYFLSQRMRNHLRELDR